MNWEVLELTLYTLLIEKIPTCERAKILQNGFRFYILTIVIENISAAIQLDVTQTTGFAWRNMYWVESSLGYENLLAVFVAFLSNEHKQRENLCSALNISSRLHEFSFLSDWIFLSLSRIFLFSLLCGGWLEWFLIIIMLNKCRGFMQCNQMQMKSWKLKNQANQVY